MKKASQISESIQLGVILAFAGGFMDAYSYMCRGEVFANAQTGNMLLFGIYLSEREWGSMVRYFFPVFAFAAGILIADILKSRFKTVDSFHWRQLSVLFEAVILFVVSFMSQDFNLMANCLTSFACGIQVESFRKIVGNGIATTMCIGNLRSGTQNMFDFIHGHSREALHKSFLYYGIILCFVAGAIVGNGMVLIIHERAIAVDSIILLICFMVMFIDLEKRETILEQ